jgi:hypothetical protein
MILILRSMKKHMGWEDAKDDYVVLDGEKSVGRICKDTHGDPKCCWSINTNPHPAPPPHNGFAPFSEGCALAALFSSTEPEETAATLSLGPFAVSAASPRNFF